MTPARLIGIANAKSVGLIQKLGPRFLPFADAASADLPLSRLLRLSLFQVSVGIALVLLNATLNRVMIVELGLPATVVTLMVALPLLFAPARALIGHRSDNHSSILGWKRTPYIFFGTALQFGGLAIMPFALLVMTGEGSAFGPLPGQIGAVLAFLMVGAGVSVTQTAGLALANDLADDDKRPRVVSLLYVMLLLGMLFASLVLGRVLLDFTPTKLAGAVQGAAVITVLLNVAATWKQEVRTRGGIRPAEDAPDFRTTWTALTADRSTRRLLAAVGLGAAGFGLQDVLLEPYGGQVLGLSVGATTGLTAMSSIGTLGGLAFAARALARDVDPTRLAATGALSGIAAFSAVIFSAPLASPALLAFGSAGIGLGGGLFGVATLTAAMQMADEGRSGIALGAWGAVQATATGLGILLSGLIRDGVGALAMAGALGPGLQLPSTGYSMVWHIEIALLFATLIALGPLARRTMDARFRASGGALRLAELPS